MKINFKHIMAALAVVALTVSCNNKADFEHEKFITLDHYSYAVDETIGEIEIPVHIYNHDCNEVQVAIRAIDDTAVQGEDYEIISPASGVLTFPSGTDSLTVKVAIKPHIGSFTGTKTFGLQVMSSTEGVGVGMNDFAQINIKDLDHPLAAFIGTWTSTGPVETAGGVLPSKTFAISADPEDLTKLIVDDFDIMFAELNGLVAPDYNRLSAQVNEDKTAFTIEGLSPLGYGTYFIAGMNSVAYAPGISLTDIEVVLNEDGTLTVPNGWITGNVQPTGSLQLNFYVNGGVTFSK